MLEINVLARNILTRYLAHDRAFYRTRLVVLCMSQGRVKESWQYGIVLGAVDPRFQQIEEEDYMAMQNQEVNLNMVEEYFG